MKTFFKSGFRWFVVFSVVCLSLGPAQAGFEIGPNVLVDPGGVEVPLLVNVLGPEKEGDFEEVREIVRAANLILQQANVQLSVTRVNTGILVGDEDSRLTAEEAGIVLLGSLFELTGTYFPDGSGSDDSDHAWARHYDQRKGVKLNIADDILVGEPDRVYWDWQLLPVAHLERAGSAEQAARNLVYGLGLTLQVPGSADSANLMFPGGAGTALNASQASAILEGLRPIGFVRSSLAQGFAPSALEGLRRKNLGAVFQPEGQGWIADFFGDVFYERGGDSGFGQGDADLLYFKVRTGSPETPSLERYLTVKAVLNTANFPDSGGVDLYLATHERGDPSEIDPFDFIDSAQVIFGFGQDFAGVINLQGDGLWNPIDGATVEKTVVGGLTQVKAEFLYEDLRDRIPGTVYQALENCGHLGAVAAANVFNFDGVNVLFEDDITDVTFKIGPVPKPLPQIDPDDRILGGGSGSPGVSVWGGRAEQPLQIDRDNVHDVKRAFFTGGIPLVQQGAGTSRYVNNYDTSDNSGDFTSLNGFADETFAGFDAPGSSPGNPADGDDDDHVGFEFFAVAELSAGLNVFGVNTTENAGYCIDIGRTTIGKSFRGLLPEGDDGANDFPESPANGASVPTQRDHALFVPEPGWYLIHGQALHTTGGFSFEFQQMLSNGDRLLAGDDDNGGARFELPTQDMIDSIRGGVNGGNNGGGNGGGGGTATVLCENFDDSFFFVLPFKTFGSQNWAIRILDDTRVAQSGPIGDNGVTSLEATLQTGDGEITFDYFVSSEGSFDHLRVFLNDSQIQSWSGQQEGTGTIPVSAGTHILRFDYEKDGSTSEGEDLARVDNICWPAP